MDDFEELFKVILHEQVWLNFHALYNKRCLDLSLEHIKDFVPKMDITSGEFIKTINVIQCRLNEIDSYFKMGQLIVNEEEMLRLYISDAQKEIDSILVDEDHTKIRSLIWELYSIIDQLRYPWRRDQKLDVKILMLSRDSKKDFYKRMMLSDFDPWKQNME